MSGASHSSREAWGSIPDSQLDKAIGRGAALSRSVLFLAESASPGGHFLIAGARLVFAAGWSAATSQGPGPGLAQGACSFLGSGQDMEGTQAVLVGRKGTGHSVACVPCSPADPGIRAG